MVKERDTAIDFVKLIAIFLVINSHMSICYGNYSFLASGGAIGDALFFFASGYTLFLGRQNGFAEWFKKRIRRIYPSLFAVAIIGAVFFGLSDSFTDVILARRYWFIQCILVLYPILYVLRKYVKNHNLILLLAGVITIAVFPVIYKGRGLMYGGGYYRWAVFSLFMLFGAILGKERHRIARVSSWITFPALIACIALWYAILYFYSSSWLQVLSVFPLFGSTFFIYELGKCNLVESFYKNEVAARILISIGALCLECYLIQKMIITDAFNQIFPFNIPFIIILIILASYITKVAANLMTQIFEPGPIDYKSLFRVY